MYECGCQGNVILVPVKKIDTSLENILVRVLKMFVPVGTNYSTINAEKKIVKMS